MSWDKVDEVLFDGTQEEIAALTCPECDGALKFKYYPKLRIVEIRCTGCGVVMKQNGVSEEPNFAVPEMAPM